MKMESDLFTVWPYILLQDFLRYFLAAGVAYLLFWVLGKNYWRHLFIQHNFPTKTRMASEFKYSMSTVLIFSIVGLSLYWAKVADRTMIYDEIHEYGLFYFAVSPLLLFVIHDTYFYWMHRLMHHDFLFKHIHRVHHQSTNPSPWAAYSFHPIEAIIEAGIFPLIVFFIPVHGFVLSLFLLFMITRNVIGHLGYEIFPAGFIRNKFLNWNTSSTHHNLHHKHFNTNYGLYFTWWDKFMNTEHKNYKQVFNEVVSRSKLNQDAI